MLWTFYLSFLIGSEATFDQQSQPKQCEITREGLCEDEGGSRMCHFWYPGSAKPPGSLLASPARRSISSGSLVLHRTVGGILRPVALDGAHTPEEAPDGTGQRYWRMRQMLGSLWGKTTKTTRSDQTWVNESCKNCFSFASLRFGTGNGSEHN